MKLRELFVFLAVTVSLVLAGKHDIYTGYTVHNVRLRNTADQYLLQELTNQLNLDIWQHGMPARQDTVVMVTPDNKDVFLAILDANGITHDVYLDDVVKALEEQDKDLAVWRSSRSNRMIFQDYQRYDEINEYMERIASQYPNLVTIINAGQSYEGRDIKYLKISTTNFTDTSKPIYFMDAMIHAREWVTTPVTLYSVFRLVENLRFEDRDLLNDIDWIILPLVNPDGYEFSHTENRLWRKTRSINEAVNTTCIGVDGNRNFDVDFGVLGVSMDPCAITYPGVAPFTEPETRIVRDILLEHIDRIQIYMDIHSYGNWILFGYGNKTLPQNAPQLHQVGAAMGAAIDARKISKARYYVVGNSGSVLYSTSGSAQDYGQYVGVPFSYTLELPGYEYFFQVPAQYMDQINEETWHGIAASARLASIYYKARFNTSNTQY